MKESELKTIIKEVIRLSRRGPIRLQRILPQDKKCFNCGEQATYNLNGMWVCDKCFPKRASDTDTPKAEKIRARRNRRWMNKQIGGMLRERTTGSVSGEWIEPNGVVHDIENQTHWEWAEDYLRSSERRFSDDAKEELTGRGWARIRYNYISSLIIVETKGGKLTGGQKKHIEDEAEERQWLVVNRDITPIYKPRICVTPDCPEGDWDLNDLVINEMCGDNYQFQQDGNVVNVYYKNLLLGNLKVLEGDKYAIGSLVNQRGEYISSTNKKTFDDVYSAAGELHIEWKKMKLGKMEEDHGLGYSHNVSFDMPTKERDPLTDPLLKKEVKQYRNKKRP